MFLCFICLFVMFLCMMFCICLFCNAFMFYLCCVSEYCSISVWTLSVLIYAVNLFSVLDG